MNVEKHTAAEVAPGAPDRASRIEKVALILALYGPRREKDAGRTGGHLRQGCPLLGVSAPKCSKPIENNGVSFLPQHKCAQAHETIGVRWGIPRCAACRRSNYYEPR